MNPRRVAAALVLLVGLVLAGSAPAAPSRATHTWHISLSAPAQFNLTFAELRFKGPGASGLGLSLTRPAGLYLAEGALVRRGAAGGPAAVVMLVNERPRGTLGADRARLGLRVTGPAGLGPPVVTEVVNPLPRLGRSPTGKRLCGLGRSHGTAAFRALLSAGRPLLGFSTAAAVAEAYDVACGLPYDPAFGRAVTGCSTSFAAGCCPPNAICAVPAPGPAPTPTPTPTPPPTPIPPGCRCPSPPPCAVGYACPLAAAREFSRAIACPLVASPAIACY